MKSAASRYLPALTWMGVIFFASSQSSLPNVGDNLVDFLAKKAAHVTVYTILALLLLRATTPFKRPALYALVIAILYAASDEYHQSLVPGREATLRDVGIDSAASALALTVERWWWLRRSPSRR